VRLHPAQKQFLRSDEPYRGLVAGIGSGKSWVGAYDLLTKAKPGRLYMVAAPTYPMLRDATLRTFLDLARHLHLFRALNRSELIVTLLHGAEVLFRSADDPERLRGPNLSGIWLDEASLMAREAYDVAIGRLREGGERGWLTATFTPKGRSHWTYDVFGRGAPDTALIKCRTRDNPFAPPGFSEQIAQQYGGLLALQELEGEFVDVAGAEWPAEYFPDSIWFDDWPKDIMIKALGLDPSKGKDAKHGDYSAIVSLGRCRQGKIWCEADLGRRTAEDIVHCLIERQREFAADIVTIETNQFQELLATQISTEAKRQAVPMPILPLVNMVKKEVRIRRLGPYLARKEVRFRATPGTRLLVEQLRDFPEGEHDDGPDACEMSLRGLIELWNGRQRQGGRR